MVIVYLPIRFILDGTWVWFLFLRQLNNYRVLFDVLSRCTYGCFV